ncbi:MAG TPA: sugar transferase [Mycobacteriales bacterium]|nr:sugar transferase [Mycobacteriales bacterium]
MLVVGGRREVVEMVRTLRREPYAGLAVVGVCLPGVNRLDAPTARLRAEDDIPVVGSLNTVAQAVRTIDADTVAVTASPAVNAATLRRLAWSLESTGVDLVVAPTLTDVAGPRVHVRPVAGLPLLHVEAPEFTGGRQLLKRLVDRCLALAFLLLLAPLLTAIALAVRWDTPGPALFRQTRVGRGGGTFTLYKFRSMVLGAEHQRDALAKDNEHDGVLFKIRQDPRVTRVGRIIRRFSLDELPQLFNVLKGDMALVGPRPPLPGEVEQYGTDVHRRLLVKPGITGLWQVSGRSDLPWQDGVRLDLYYVENWSLTLDLMILWKTLFTVVRAEGAY